MDFSQWIDNQWLSVLKQFELFGLPVLQVLGAAATALLSYIVLSLVLRLVSKRAGHFANGNTLYLEQLVAEVVRSTQHWLLAIVALLIGLGLLDLPERWHHRVAQLWFIVVAVQCALWINCAVTFALRHYYAKQSAVVNPQLSASATLISGFLRTLIWTVVLLGVMSNLGVNITAFITSLGIGGIAVALAAQNILGDLFASIAIVIDKPFEVGDSITIGTWSGTVERLGLKTTRIRSIGGEQIVMSNTELLKQTIRNFKRLHTRRIVFNFGLSYDTGAAQAEAVPGILKNILEKLENVRFDRAHLRAFGPTAIEYEVVYTVLESDYGLYMDRQQHINIQMMQAFANLGVSFAHDVPA